MAEMHASCEALIAAGWGETERCDIPPDWRERNGPDQIPGQPNAKRPARPRRLTWKERRALYLQRSMTADLGGLTPAVGVTPAEIDIVGLGES